MASQVDTNDSVALFNMGSFYERQGSLDKAEEFYLKSAELHNIDAVDAVNRLGSFRKDPTKTEEFYRKGASFGNAHAMNRLAAFLARQGKEEEAKSWFLKSAEKGHVASMVAMGICYEKNDRDIAGARVWYHKAAEHNNTDAMTHLGDLYMEEEDFENAEKWFLKSAKQGNVGGMLRLGSYYIQGLSFSNAEKWYLEAAKLCNSDAMCQLGTLYKLRGHETKALEWFLKAYTLGHNDAAHSSAKIYEATQQYDKAREMYLKMQNQNYGLYCVGTMYFYKKDYKEAFEFLSKVTFKSEIVKGLYQPPESYVKELIEICKKKLVGLDKIYGDVHKDDCVVCYCKLIGTSSPVTILVCGHMFHQNCIKKETKCPFCRVELL
jgi:TPR repeat protein